jgi:hypothetical protein
MRATCPVLLVVPHFIILIIIGKACKLDGPHFEFFRGSCYFFHLRFKYFPQYPLLRDLNVWFSGNIRGQVYYYYYYYYYYLF